MTRRRPAVLWPLTHALLFVAAGCGDEGRQRVERYTLGDTSVVVSAEPVHPVPASLRPVVRFGEFNGTREETFNRIGAIAVRPDGRLLASDGGTGLKQFRPDGTFERWIALDGEGPEEVKYAKALAVRQDGAVAVDLFYARRTISVFEPDSSVQTIRFPERIRARHGEDALQFHDGGTLWVGINPAFVRNDVPLPRPAFVGYSDGEWSDTILVPAKYGTDCPARSEREHAIGFWEDNRAPFVPMAKWALGPDGSKAFGCNASPEFDVYRPDGSILRVRWATDPVPFVKGELEQMSAWIGLEASEVSDRPIYARLIPTEEGRIWVWPHSTPDTVWIPDENGGRSNDFILNVGERGAFFVFEPDGNWLGSVEIPEELQYSGYPTENPVVIRGDTIWAVTVDEYDVEYVTRYEVVWPELKPR